MMYQDDILDVLWPSEWSLLSRVDEYYLYSYYLGYEPWPGKAYHSPVRPHANADDAPSWAIFQLSNPYRCEFTWKDFATGQKGDIFDMICIMKELQGETTTRRDVMNEISRLIEEGLKLPIPGQIERPAGFGEFSDIRIKSRPFHERERLYWLEIGVDKRQLAKYNITAITHWWLNGSIRYAGAFSFAYRIHKHYQLYFPYAARERKFRNNFDENDIPGWSQLPPEGELLIITKSYKDVAAIDAWGFNAISPRGENIPIAEHFLKEAEQRFKRIVTLFDNDGKFKKDYPYQYLHVPPESGQKDPTDYARAFGVPAAIEMVRSLL